VIFSVAFGIRSKSCAWFSSQEASNSGTLKNIALLHHQLKWFEQ